MMMVEIPEDIPVSQMVEATALDLQFCRSVVITIGSLAYAGSRPSFLALCHMRDLLQSSVMSLHRGKAEVPSGPEASVYDLAGRVESYDKRIRTLHPELLEMCNVLESPVTVDEPVTITPQVHAWNALCDIFRGTEEQAIIHQCYNTLSEYVDHHERFTRLGMLMGAIWESWVTPFNIVFIRIRPTILGRTAGLCASLRLDVGDAFDRFRNAADEELNLEQRIRLWWRLYDTIRSAILTSHRGNNLPEKCSTKERLARGARRRRSVDERSGKTPWACPPGLRILLDKKAGHQTFCVTRIRWDDAYHDTSISNGGHLRKLIEFFQAGLNDAGTSTELAEVLWPEGQPAHASVTRTVRDLNNALKKNNCLGSSGIRPCYPTKSSGSTTRRKRTAVRFRS